MNDIKKIFWLLICCWNLGSLRAQDTSNVHNFTLEKCLDYAFRNNYNRQVLKLSEESMAEELKQSKLERLPDLNASASETFSSNKVTSSAWNGDYSLNAGLMLYQGGAINNTIEQNKLKMEQSQYQTSQYENELTVQILQAFLTVLGSTELYKYQEVVLQASDEQRKQGKIQFAAGSILESDYLLLEAQYANDQNNILDTKISLDNNILVLKKLLSMNPSETLTIIYPDTAAIDKMVDIPQLDYVLKTAMETLPDLKISQYNVDIANYNTKLAKSSYLPTLSLRGSVGTGHVQDFNNYSTQLSDQVNGQVGLSLNIPIYNKNATKTKVNQSRIAYQQAELDRKQTELDITQTVVTEYQNLVSAYSKYQATTIRQEAYFKTFEAYRIQFNVGAITAVDLLQQQNNYISALNDYIQSKYGFMLKRKVLDVYLGEKITM